MDLNASPLPDDDDNLGHGEKRGFPVERCETAVETANREREERRKRLRNQRIDDRQTQLATCDQPLPNKQHRLYDRRKIPSGWLDCPSFGSDIFSLVPSKVPLDETYNDYVPPGKRYSFRQVLHHHQCMGKKIGLVVDLTNTSRYYSAEQLKREGMKYCKINCKGHESVPDAASVNNFVYEVTQFIARKTKLFILVHCTHGHNRTGYMIIHYLMRFHPISVSEGLQIFADSRPPGIYKQEYIDALYAFYHEMKPKICICPDMPEWKKPSELDLNGEVVQEEDGSETIAKENNRSDDLMTNDDVLGDDIPVDQLVQLQQYCYHLLKLRLPNRGDPHFPGSHPVSLNRENLQLLRQRYYYATWKADGTRYMMLIMTDGCYLIDRNFNFRRIQMRFPFRNPNEGGALDLHHGTLLDGEMIIDTIPNTLKQERRYLIYDLMAVNQVSIIERPFFERWKMIETEVIEPRSYEKSHMPKSRNPSYVYDFEPFRVRRKDFWLLSAVIKLLKGFIPTLSHAADGLIFQGWDDPYVTRTHEGLLKWKFPEMNSVDFLFELDEGGNQLLYIYERGSKKRMESSTIVFGDDLNPHICAGKIIECSWDQKDQVWVCMRIRTDKSIPNDINTYMKVMRSIKDNITEDVLLQEIDATIRLPMYDERIKEDKRRYSQARSAKPR